MLRDLNLSRSYRKGTDDIAGQFYVPCLTNSKTYDRAVGFFSSAIYLLAWDALVPFVKRGGRIRIICSPFLSEPDIDALSRGYDSKNAGEYEAMASKALEEMIEDDSKRKPTQVLATLVSLGVIDLRVAFIGANQVPAFSRLFHDKVGLFHDGQGSAVAFKGSMNETWNGLSNDGNLESIDVYVSWEHDRENARVRDEEEYFESLWADRYPSTTVRPFPDAARNRLLSIAQGNDWEQIVDDIRKEIEETRRLAPSSRPTAQVPRPHQFDAIRKWISAGRRGILEHATGSGKTFTAICAIKEEMDRGKVPLVIVPSELLQSQWAAELNHHLDNLSPRILRCGAGFDTWRSSNLLGPWSRPISNSDGRIILATVQTASRSDFLQRVRQGDHLFLVGDEVHRLGSGMHRNVLSIETGPRLGLSATPVRYGDQEGTKAIFDYFGPVIPPPYTVADAVKAGTLTPYFYFVRLVPLTEEEQERWDQASRDIGIFFARYKGVMHQSPEIQARFNQLLIARARIIKGASRKIDTAVQTLLEEFKAGQRWLVYCEDQVQLNRMLVALRREGLPASEYHSAMVGDKERTLTDLRINGGIVVSIRCLDEGVDIPSVSHALIMASSKNPREFIQRRGRVLRRSEGKTFSNIFDLLAVPTTIDQSEGSNSFVAGEIARAAEFATNASNPSATLEVRRVATRFNIDIEHLVQAGLEDDIDD